MAVVNDTHGSGSRLCWVLYEKSSHQTLDRNGVLTQVVKAAVIRDIAGGIVPGRQNITGRAPFNLVKSEKLIWMIQDVDYLEVVTRRERRGSSHGLSVRVAKGLCYRPGSFRSRSVEWEETVHADTGLLDFTTKHLYFSEPAKKFRLRYDKIVDFEPFEVFSLLSMSESSALLAVSLPLTSPAMLSISSAIRGTNSVIVSSVRIRSLIFSTTKSSPWRR